MIAIDPHYLASTQSQSDITPKNRENLFLWMLDVSLNLTWTFLGVYKEQIYHWDTSKSFFIRWHHAVIFCNFHRCPLPNRDLSSCAIFQGISKNI